MQQYHRVVAEAPAKLNLFLDVTGRLANGYHSLDSVMQAIDLADVVVVGRRAEGGLVVSCSRPDIPAGPANLAYRAAEAFLRAADISSGGFHIHIDKLLPSGAGLGGGSADAAAVLVALNELCGAGFPPQRLCELGMTVGADVPFLVRGGSARAEGVGEKLTPLFPGLRPCPIVVAKPDAGVDTAEAFAAYDRRGMTLHKSSDKIRSAIATADLARTAAHLFNVFEQLPGLPEVARLKAAMLERGALGAAMTGSGSAVFGLFAEEAAAESCRAALSAPGVSAFLAKPVPFGARVLHQS